MTNRIRATYRDGVFIPDEPFTLQESTVVQLTVELVTTPPAIADPVERARCMAALLERMQNNPIPPDAPRFTREELHERR